MRRFFIPTRWHVLGVAALAVGATLFVGRSWLARETLVPVSGQVTVDGRPVVNGLILFSPNKAKGNSYPRSTQGFVKDGVYAFMVHGKRGGVPPGWYRVTIQGFVSPRERAPLGRAEVVREAQVLIEAVVQGGKSERKRMDPKTYYSNYNAPHAVEVAMAAEDGTCDVHLTKSGPRKAASGKKQR